jgi:hypothetical protein
MKKPQVTVVGSFAVGLTMRAPKLPIFGETMLGTDFDMSPGGKGSNQAVATARLGARSTLLAMIGIDKLASIATYEAEGVDMTLLSGRTTDADDPADPRLNGQCIFAGRARQPSAAGSGRPPARDKRHQDLFSQKRL